MDSLVAAVVVLDSSSKLLAEQEQLDPQNSGLNTDRIPCLDRDIHGKVGSLKRQNKINSQLLPPDVCEPPAPPAEDLLGVLPSPPTTVSCFRRLGREVVCKYADIYLVAHQFTNEMRLSSGLIKSHSHYCDAFCDFLSHQPVKLRALCTSAAMDFVARCQHGEGNLITGL